MSLEIPYCAGVAGFYRMEALRLDADGSEIAGSRRVVADWFPNIITNTGLDLLGTKPQSNVRGCHVGSGSTAPSFTDTALASFVAATTSRLSGSNARNLAATPKYVSLIRVFRFATGVAAGNLTEVGVTAGDNDSAGAGGAASPTAALFSRALILDGSGNPTTVTVLADETLDVTYEVRIYMPTADVTGTTVLGGVTYNYTLRACEIDQNPGTNAGGWGAISNYSPSVFGIDFTHRQSGGYGENAAFTGASSAIGAETGSPTGTACGAGFDSGNGPGSIATQAYVAGTHYLDLKISYQLGTSGQAINSADGIGAIMFSTGVCSAQIGFSPRLPKTADKVFDFTIRVVWARYTP